MIELVRVIMQNRKILLLDEATSNIDFKSDFFI